MDGCFIGEGMLSQQVFSEGQFVPVVTTGEMIMGMDNSHNNNDSGYNDSPLNNWAFNNSVMDNNGFSDGNTNNNSVANSIGTQPNWHQQLYSTIDLHLQHQAVVSTASGGVLVPQSSSGYYQVTPQNAGSIMGTSQRHPGVNEYSRNPYGSNENVPSPSSGGASVKSYPLRTNIKMQLQRDKALIDKKREESMRKTVGSDVRSSNPVNIQVATSPLQVASQHGQIVNQKSSGLANPTLYHLQAKARAEGGGKVARFSGGLNAVGGGGGSVPPGHALATASAIQHHQNSLGVLTGKVVAVHGSAPPNVYGFSGGIPNHYDSVSASPLEPESVRSVNSATSECSNNLSEYHTDDINDGMNTIRLTEDGQEVDGFYTENTNSVTSLPLHFPTGGGNSSHGVGAAEGRLRVKGTAGATARSAPTVSGKLSPLTSAQQQQDKDRQKKNNHNKIEKNRRKKINGNIHELATLFPKEKDDPHFQIIGELKNTSKGAILHHAVQYTKLLQEENSDVKKSNKEIRKELDEARKRVLMLNELCISNGIMCTSNGIPVPGSVARSTERQERVEGIQIKQEPLPFDDERNILLGDPACDMRNFLQGSGDIMLAHHVDDDGLEPDESDLGLMGAMELS